MKEDGMTMLIRLFNSGKKSRVIKLNWKQRKPEKMFVRYPNGRKTLNGALEISPLEIVTMEAEFPAKSTR